LATTSRIQVRLQSTSLIPENDSMNVWHFRTPTSTPADVISNITNALNTFYASIADIYNVNTLTGLVTYKAYDLVDSTPRTPYAEGTIGTFTFSDADALPTECAITMSFEGELSSGTNRARRRGRLYLGPLDIGPASTTDGFVRVGITSAELIRDAANELLAGQDATYTWSVFSPTAAGAQPWSAGSIAAATTAVHHGWIDDAFDTQRRRGTQANFRYVIDGVV